jgi:NAD(P)-dependent dehydrogenase (short-subunit alcohol dehydrogenase family)
MNTKRRTILITGGAQRIGRALVEHFAALGWRVIVHYHRSHQEAKDLQEQLTAQKYSCEIIAADLLTEAEVQALIPTINQRWGSIDSLINNASIFEHDDVASSTRQDWDSHMETNLRAPFVLSQTFAKQVPAPTDATIINILDQRVWNLTQHFISYTLSKFGLWGLTQTMALALAPHIRVNGIGPGPALANHRQTAADFHGLCLNTPLKRGPRLDEICRAAQFIIDSPSMTGQMIALDGGQHLGWSFPHPLQKTEE